MNEVDSIFDAIHKASALVIREDRWREELHRLWEASNRRCGNCFFWMKSSSCPREHNVNGYNRGPHMNSVACKKFERTAMAEAALKEWEKLRDAGPEVGGDDD